MSVPTWSGEEQTSRGAYAFEQIVMDAVLVLSQSPRMLNRVSDARGPGFEFHTGRVVGKSKSPEG